MSIAATTVDLATLQFNYSALPHDVASESLFECASLRLCA